MRFSYYAIAYNRDERNEQFHTNEPPISIEYTDHILILSNTIPSVISSKKNMMAHITEPVIMAIASGYTMNTRPGPVSQKKLSEQCVKDLIS